MIIPPSSRPLLLWLAASAVCAAVLTCQGIMLVTHWRRSSRPWRLGLAALGLGALAVALTGRILAAYHNLVNISACYSDGCQDAFPLVTNAVTIAVILGEALIVATCVMVVAAIALSASESGQQATPMRGAWNQVDRYFNLTLYVAIFYLGMHWAADGIALLAQTAYLLTPGAAGDGIGMIPFGEAVAEIVLGVIALGLGACLVWFSARRPAPPLPQGEGAGG